MPDITIADLSRYRLHKAGEMLVSARRDVEAEDYASANNRAYYCIFHTMRDACGTGLGWPGFQETLRSHIAVYPAVSQNRHLPKGVWKTHHKCFTHPQPKRL